MVLEYRGKFASCKVMTDNIEATAVQQIYSFLNSPAFKDSKIRIMPDVHAGAGAVIGFTGTLTDKIIPNVIGVDIGCGVLSIDLGKQVMPEGRLAEFDRWIRNNIPAGFSINNKLDDDVDTKSLHYRLVAVATSQDDNRVVRSLGTLGGGNHFIELGVDQNSHLWLTIHTGSRNFGLKIATFHQQKAVPTIGKGHGLEYLEGKDAELYFHHMKIAQDYARFNRRIIAQKLVNFFGVSLRMIAESRGVESVHNYIDFESQIIRKGAIAANRGQRVVIPWNMKDGLIIGTGRGNEDWNCSAPHGAGRVMGRGQAKKNLSMDEFREKMKGIWSSSISRETLDESPMVYKNHEEIQRLITDTVDIELFVKPIYNFKASGE